MEKIYANFLQAWSRKKTKSSCVKKIKKNRQTILWNCSEMYAAFRVFSIVGDRPMEIYCWDQHWIWTLMESVWRWPSTHRLNFIRWVLVNWKPVYCLWVRNLRNVDCVIVDVALISVESESFLRTSCRILNGKSFWFGNRCLKIKWIEWLGVFKSEALNGCRDILEIKIQVPYLLKSFTWNVYNHYRYLSICILNWFYDHLLLFDNSQYIFQFSF